MDRILPTENCYFHIGLVRKFVRLNLRMLITEPVHERDLS